MHLIYIDYYIDLLRQSHTGNADKMQYMRWIFYLESSLQQSPLCVPKFTVIWH